MNKENFTAGRVNGYKCKAGKQQSIYWDDKTPGLGLRVTAAGARSYIFETSLHNKTIRLTIGDARTWSVGKAQEEATRLKVLTDQGLDPRKLIRERQEAIAAKKEAQATARLEAERRKHLTLRALLEAYTRLLDSKGKSRSAASTRSAFKCHVFTNEIVASTPANEVTSHQIAALVRKVQEAGKVRAAGILRSYISAAYNAAKKAPFSATLPADLISYNIESNPVEAVPAIVVTAGHRILSAEELGAYISHLGNNLTDIALHLSLLAGGQRIAQLLRATVADFDSDLKTLRLFDPKGKRTTPREHLLPLAPKAVAIVGKLVERAKENKKTRLFTSQDETMMALETPGKRVTKICSAMGCEPFNLRDIRRTCETMLAGMSISRDTRAQLLSHGISGVQAAHYDRHDYFKEKQAALAAWEDRLDEIATGKKRSNVVRMHAKSNVVT
jgi:integrase